MPSVPAELAGGVGLLGRSLAFLVKRPRLFWLGALPPLVTSVLFVVLFVVLVGELGPITAALTPFANGWTPGWATTARIVVGVVLLGAAVLLMVLIFTTLTLALGSPVYDAISEAVDRACPVVRGDDPPQPPAEVARWRSRSPSPPPERDEPVATGVVRVVRQTVALVAVSAVGSVVLFGIGFVPVAGQVASAVGGALFGGWMLAIELVGSPLERRGVLTLRGRRQSLASRRWRSLGLGVPSFLLLSIPFVAVVVFPVATAAGTLLARQLLGEPVEEPSEVTGR